LYTPETGDPVVDFSANWDIAPICSELSRLVYYRFEESKGDRPRLEAALARAGFEEAGYFNNSKNDAQAVAVVAPGKALFVAFRGTQSRKPQDVLKDLEFPLVDWEGHRVHAGFRDAYASIRSEIDEWLARAPDLPLFVTGHSLGAAMATLMAAVRAEAQLVTFGSPVVGDRAFASQFDDRPVRRYLDCNDIVATVPPALFGYVHLRDLHYIDRLGVVHPSPPDAAAMAEDRAAGRRIYLKKFAWNILRNVLTRRFADHAPINYVSAVLDRRRGP
jgi:pimeloyl-ACP methyl ester carboxylesterase